MPYEELKRSGRVTAGRFEKSEIKELLAASRRDLKLALYGLHPRFPEYARHEHGQNQKISFTSFSASPAPARLMRLPKV